MKEDGPQPKLGQGRRGRQLISAAGEAGRGRRGGLVTAPEPVGVALYVGCEVAPWAGVAVLVMLPGWRHGLGLGLSPADSVFTLPTLAVESSMPPDIHPGTQGSELCSRTGALFRNRVSDEFTEKQCVEGKAKTRSQL